MYLTLLHSGWMNNRAADPHSRLPLCCRRFPGTWGVSKKDFFAPVVICLAVLLVLPEVGNRTHVPPFGKFGIILESFGEFLKVCGSPKPVSPPACGWGKSVGNVGEVGAFVDSIQCVRCQVLLHLRMIVINILHSFNCVAVPSA